MQRAHYSAPSFRFFGREWSHNGVTVTSTRFPIQQNAEDQRELSRRRESMWPLRTAGAARRAR